MSGRFHGPETGLWRERLGRFYFTGVFWYRLPMRAVRVLPSWMLPPIVFIFAGIFTVLLPRVRRALAANTALVLGPASTPVGWLRAFRTLRNFSWCLTERFEQFVPKVELDAEIKASPAARALFEDKRPIIYVTAHFGGWEIGSVAARGSGPDTIVHSVREKEIDPESDAYLRELLDGLGGARYRIHYADQSADLGIKLLEALQAGESVALQADRPATDGKAIELDFLGQRIEVPAGPAVLARVAGVPLLPVFTPRTGRRKYRVEIGEPITVARTADRDADIRDAMTQVMHRIEAAVRQTPHQWFALRRIAPQ